MAWNARVGSPDDVELALKRLAIAAFYEEVAPQWNVNNHFRMYINEV